jgi:hypothetical protein
LVNKQGSLEMFLKKNGSQESQSAIKNIVTLNAYTGKKYIFKGDKFQPLKKLTYNKANFITSYLSNKDFITTTTQVSRSIPEEDIADVLEIKAYEELGLDQASDYVISSYEVESSGEEREFHLFVAETDTLTNLYFPIKQETKYLDLIVPSPLLYRALYTKEILKEDGGVHCFVYFTKFDAFVTFYKEGNYLYSKSIEFSLEQIYEKFCEMEGEQVDKNEFFSVLETEGLKATDNKYQQNFMKIFGEVFITINDIIIYTKRAFQLDSVDHMYIGSVQGPIVGLDEYSHNYLGLPSADFNFDYNINNDEWYTDQLQYLMLLTSLEYMEDESTVLNLTMFPRPPAFVNRASGQFIIATFAAISIGLAYPLYHLVSSYANDAKTFALSKQDEELKVEAKHYKKILGEKKKEISRLDKELNRLAKLYGGKTRTLQSIYNEKVNYRLKSGIFYLIAEELNQFDVFVDKIFTKEDTVWMSLVSSDDRKLTELIKYISNTHFNEIKEIDIKLIEKDPNSKHYRGLLKVVFR